MHGSGLGRWRWVVARTFAWLHEFRRLRVRSDKRADIHEAFLPRLFVDLLAVSPKGLEQGMSGWGISASHALDSAARIGFA